MADIREVRIELTDDRGENFKKFQNPDGSFTVESTKNPWHYKENYDDDESPWLDIEPDYFVENETYYEFNRLPGIVRLYKDRTGYEVTNRRTGHVIRVELDSIDGEARQLVRDDPKISFTFEITRSRVRLWKERKRDDSPTEFQWRITEENVPDRVTRRGKLGFVERVDAFDEERKRVEVATERRETPERGVTLWKETVPQEARIIDTDVSFFSHTADGTINSFHSTWATARGATTGTADSSTPTQIFYTALYDLDSNYYVYRVFFTFDTSSIPDSASIVSAELDVAIFNVNQTGDHNGTRQMVLLESTQASDTELADADFDNFNTTELAPRVTVSTAGHHIFTLNASGLALINKTGYTKFCVQTDLDRDDTTPVSDTAGFDAEIAFVERMGTTNDPVLSITYFDQRFWVGGTGNWNDTAHWSLTSGGSGGASVPTSAENAIFDGNSGGGTVTLNTAASCHDLNMSAAGSTTVAGTNTIACYGSFTLSDQVQWSGTGTITFAATSTGKSVTVATATFNCNFTFDGVGGGWTMTDGASQVLTLSLVNGALILASGESFTTVGIDISGASVRSFIMDGAIVYITAGGWDATTTTNLTFSADNSNIRIGSGIGSTFDGGGLTYGFVRFTNGNMTVTGNNIFEEIIVEDGYADTLTFTGNNTIEYAYWSELSRTQTCIVRFTEGTTQTFTYDFRAVANATHGITIKSVTDTNAHTLTMGSGGTVIAEYVTIKDSHATGGATWSTTNCINDGGNSGWIFLQTVTLTETMSLSEIFSALKHSNFIETITETMVLSENFIKKTTRTVTEALVHTDSFSALIVYIRTMIETQVLTDTITRGFIRTFSETSVLTDAVLKTLAKTFSEVTVFLDTIARVTVKTITENTKLTEIFSRGVSFVRTLTENSKLTDMFATVYVRTLTEAMRFDEFISVVLNGIVTALWAKQPKDTGVYTPDPARDPHSDDWVKQTRDF